MNFISAIARQKLEDLAMAAIQTNSVTQVTKVQQLQLQIKTTPEQYYGPICFPFLYLYTCSKSYFFPQIAGI